jgi:hypothetical protein
MILRVMVPYYKSGPYFIGSFLELSPPPLFGRWPVACGLWPVAFGLWPVACDLWP